MQRTQFGFRAKRSTSAAIHCVRRAAEEAEITGQQVSLVLLDWEKAFDRLTRKGLFSALQRMGVPIKLQNIIKSLYENPKFKVEYDGQTSD
eukprot:5024364-Pyramimonas_sp.AAC.1